MSEDTTQTTSDIQTEIVNPQRKPDSKHTTLHESSEDPSAKQRQEQDATEDEVPKGKNSFNLFEPVNEYIELPMAKKKEVTYEIDDPDYLGKTTNNRFSPIPQQRNEASYFKGQDSAILIKNERPPRRILSAKPTFTDFSHFKKKVDYGTLFDASKTSQNIIETLQNIISEDQEDINLIPVDWLGIPLAPRTLPDFKSTTKQDFTRPDQRKLKEFTARRTELPQKELFDQFSNISWVPRDLTPRKIGNGHAGKHGVLKTLLLHPKSSIWHLPETRLNQIKKSDPMEYINLLDPQNVISTEKAMYQWISKDQGAIGLNVTVGNSVTSSGYLSNQLPHLPLQENRDFVSVYKKSFCIRPPNNDIEGLAEPLQQRLSYPGYHGGSSMRDVPSSFLRLAPNVLKTQPNFLDRKKSIPRRAMSARPVP